MNNDSVTRRKLIECGSALAMGWWLGAAPDGDQPRHDGRVVARGMAIAGGSELRWPDGTAGQAVAQPTRPLAHVAIGALDEAALYVAAAEDREAATAEVAAVLDRVVDSFSS